MPVTGLNEATVAATSGNGYESGKAYAVYISGVTPPTPEPTAPADVGAGRARRRRKIILRIDGQEHELEDLPRVLELIKEAKKAIPEVARETAAQIVATGRRVGAARKTEEAAIELVSAPSSVQGIIEDRINEMQRFYWERVAAYAKALDDDDNEVMELQ